MSTVRRAKHAGAWYPSSGPELRRQLDRWLGDVDVKHAPARAIIVPHAGYQYSGACGAYSYHQVDPNIVRRVFILGPSHHRRIDGCALTLAHHLATPLLDLPIDTVVNDQLMATGHFTSLPLDADEQEHSIELQLPYLARVLEAPLQRGQVTVVPIVVGAMPAERERHYGQLLAKYLADPHALFVVSSDFCHWGQCFRYTYHDEAWGKEPYQTIERMDRLGLDIIESLDPERFSEYLMQYGNTICGRHPIAVFLHALRCCVDTLRVIAPSQCRIKCLHYTQSNRCRSAMDNSVSYAAASLVIRTAS